MMVCISRALAPLARGCGFRVVVTDEKEDLTDKSRFPDAAEVLCCSFQEAFDRIRIDEGSYLVIVTAGHQTDEYCLAEALKRPSRYVGMIGSKRKIQTIFGNLKSRGVSEKALSRVHAPIGLPIAAKAPREIAVSILAELIKVKNEDEK